VFVGWFTSCAMACTNGTCETLGETTPAMAHDGLRGLVRRCTGEKSAYDSQLQAGLVRAQTILAEVIPKEVRWEIIKSVPIGFRLRSKFGWDGGQGALIVGPVQRSGAAAAVQETAALGVPYPIVGVGGGGAVLSTTPGKSVVCDAGGGDTRGDNDTPKPLSFLPGSPRMAALLPTLSDALRTSPEMSNGLLKADIHTAYGTDSAVVTLWYHFTALRRSSPAPAETSVAAEAGARSLDDESKADRLRRVRAERETSTGLREHVWRAAAELLAATLGGDGGRGGGSGGGGGGMSAVSVVARARGIEWAVGSACIDERLELEDGVVLRCDTLLCTPSVLKRVVY
jgi:hypothetical protein